MVIQHKEKLENDKAALELLLSENGDKCIDYKAQLEQAKKDLADINKPELTSSQFDDIQEAVKSGIATFDFDDTDNFDKDFNNDYDNKICLENFDFTNHTDLVEMIVEKVSKLFVEKLDTTEADNHTGITGIPNGDTMSDTE